MLFIKNINFLKNKNKKSFFCNEHTSNVTRFNNKKILLLDSIKIYIIIRNIFEILLFDNKFKSYSINLNEYKKLKYFNNFF